MSLAHADGGVCACHWLCLGVEDTAEHGLTNAEMCNLFTAFAMLRTGTQLVTLCGGGGGDGGRGRVMVVTVRMAEAMRSCAGGRRQRARSVHREHTRATPWSAALCVAASPCVFAFFLSFVFTLSLSLSLSLLPVSQLM